MLRGIFFVIFKSPESAAKAVVYMSTSEDYDGITNEYLHMFNKKKMDPKVYEEDEGIKLWNETYKLWKQVDPNFVSLSTVD